MGRAALQPGGGTHHDKRVAATHASLIFRPILGANQNWVETYIAPVGFALRFILDDAVQIEKCVVASMCFLLP